jgi:glycosyltransferase involved in cell wall biosynthesis
MRIGVVIPTYQRAATLERAVRSVIAQTHQDWRLHVLDDGSTDGTESIMNGLVQIDPRIVYSRDPVNRGAVFRNEIGMHLAMTKCDAWSRLGSDDLFLPRKLELDAIALQDAGVCFGPYRHTHRTDGVFDHEGNYPHDARRILLGGAFTASWANIAARSDVLRNVYERHGMFCDPRLRNMEDWIWNVRAARFSEFVWRGELNDGRICIGATQLFGRKRAFAEDPNGDDPNWGYKPDACYTLAQPTDTVSCTYSKEGTKWSGLDMAMTGIVRGEDVTNGLAGVDEIPKPAMRFI